MSTFIDEDGVAGEEPNDILNEPPIEGEEPVEGAPTGESAEQKELKRYEYWQSIADKRGVELDELRSVKPVADLLRRRPELIDKLEEELIDPSQRAPQRPQPPAMPIGYDPIAAHSDMQSESYRYQVQKEKYMQDMLEYNESLVIRQQRYIEEQTRKQAETDQQRQVIAKTRLMAAQKGLKGEEIDEFVDLMLSPGKTSFDHLVDLYKVVKAKKGKAPVAPARVPVTGMPPPPPISIGGGDESKMTPADLEFSAALLARNKKRV